MVVEVVIEKSVTHQRPYLEIMLKKRGLMAPNFGNSLPEPREGHYLQEDKDTPQCLSLIHISEPTRLDVI
eukprot:6043822-Prorocentrum_lima.AAC.1